MDPIRARLHLTRRDFLTGAASGIGGAALATLLHEDRARAAGRCLTAIAPRARSCIFLFMEGGASHLDFFSYKPRLARGAEYDGKLVRDVAPKELLDGQFAFIDKSKATFFGTPFKFQQHGQSGLWFSELVPNLARHADKICMLNTVVTSQFNHHPAQLVMQTGVNLEGHPSMGSWLTYGLCNSANKNFPDYVVMNAGGSIFGGATLWQSGFLPSNYTGVLLNTTGTPILDLDRPRGFSRALERRALDALDKMDAANDLYRKRMMDPAIASQIDNYELAFNMQDAAPALMDVSKDDKYIDAKDPYGTRRDDPPEVSTARRAPPPRAFGNFARHCLLARRMIQNGVRFVNLFSGHWDHHSNIYDSGDQPGAIPIFARLVDQPVAALLDDLEEKGLLDTTLVVWGSEFGRTPIAEIRPRQPGDPPWIPGRDHHPHAFTMWMAGGGVKGGTAIGETDDYGFFPKDKGTARDQSVDISDVHATILRQFGIDHAALTFPYRGVPMRLTPLTREAHPLDGDHPAVKAGVLAAAI